MKLDYILSKITALQQRTAVDCQMASAQLADLPIFDATVFNTKNGSLTDYQQEISQNISTLQRIKNRNPQAFQWLSDKVLQQLLALQKVIREHSANNLSIKLSQSQQYQHYYHRLQTMYETAERRLATATTLIEQQHIGKEIDVLLQRIRRCQAAIDQAQWQDMFNS